MLELFLGGIMVINILVGGVSGYLTERQLLRGILGPQVSKRYKDCPRCKDRKPKKSDCTVCGGGGRVKVNRKKTVKIASSAHKPAQSPSSMLGTSRFYI